MRSDSEVRTIDSKRGSLGADVVQIVRDLHGFRGLLYQFTLRDVRIRYKQAVMGFGWAVFVPVMIICSGTLVRFAMARLAGTELDGAVIAAVAVRSVPWAFFIAAIGFANTVLIGNRDLVTKIYFPREMLPLASVLAQIPDGLIGVSVLLILMPVLGIAPSLTWLWGLPIAALLLLFTSGLAFVLSSANLFFRDVKYIVQVLLTFGIFFTPVFYEAAMLGPKGSALIMLNPLAPLLEGLRLAVIDGHDLTEVMAIPVAGADVLAWSPWYLVYGAGCAFVTFVGGALLFHRLESLFAEYV